MPEPTTELQSFHEAYEAQRSAFEERMLPSSLMDCFNAFRARELRRASVRFTAPFQSHLLAMVNELRGVKDSKEDFDLLFDPTMYFTSHAQAWEEPPGRAILLPAMNTTVVANQPLGSALRTIADEEYTQLLRLSETYMDEDMIGLAEIAKAGYGDLKAGVMDRRAAIRYVAINASAHLEDIWAKDERCWEDAGDRLLTLPDMESAMKFDLISNSTACSPVTESDLECYTEEDVKLYAFDTERFLKSGKTTHMALCFGCQERVGGWLEWAKKAEEAALTQNAGKLPQA